MRWGECDAQGIVFDAQYLNYIEAAQAEYCRDLGVLLYNENPRKHFDVATVNVTLKYLASARVHDLLDVYMRAVEIGNISITILVVTQRQTPEKLLMTGEVVYIAYDSVKGRARPVPDDVRGKITRFEANGT